MEENQEEKQRKGRGKKLTLKEKVDKYSNKGEKPYNYLYTIIVNQKCIIENGWWELDMIDIAIFNAIYHFISIGRPKTYEDHKKWYWVEESKILKDVPLLPLSSTIAVYVRVQKLINYGLIERNPDNSRIGMSYLKLGVNAQKMIYTQ